MEDANPKYAHLPGIAYDQPDFYETSDLPEADQSHDDPEEDSESIEHLHINASTAFDRFKGKVLDAKTVDFSDRLSRKLRTGYTAQFREYELVGQGEKETPLQKYQRIKCEMKELMEEITKIKEDESSELPNSAIINHLETMNRQLEELRLDRSLGTEVVSNLADPQGAQIKKMLTSLDKLGGSWDSPSRTSEAAVDAQRGQPYEVRYQVLSRPQQAHLAQVARIAELEERVKKLNSLVSSAPDNLRRIGGQEKSLSETARLVSSKVALLETSQLEAVEARMAGLLTKMDQVAERTSAITGSTDVDRDNMIRELYELAKTAEEMTQLLPRTLDRMAALEGLHQQGTNFVKSLNQIESMQQVLANSCETTKEAVKKLEENFSASIKSLKKSLEDVDTKARSLAESRKKS
ncbi:Dynactin subunit [Nesidiocoris tenuis]|uniref:Dynactin subunit n=1 Tax=Nesidiocoris tenuis TaxID=355587 RepID=A0ABN7B2M0_9HEMI|nr:Dynactin subunit [Nesidiocoris tenuis]